MISDYTGVVRTGFSVRVGRCPCARHLTKLQRLTAWKSAACRSRCSLADGASTPTNSTCSSLNSTNAVFSSHPRDILARMSLTRKSGESDVSDEDATRMLAT